MEFNPDFLNTTVVTKPTSLEGLVQYVDQVQVQSSAWEGDEAQMEESPLSSVVLTLVDQDAVSRKQQLEKEEEEIEKKREAMKGQIVEHGPERMDDGPIMEPPAFPNPSPSMTETMVDQAQSSQHDVITSLDSASITSALQPQQTPASKPAVRRKKRPPVVPTSKEHLAQLDSESGLFTEPSVQSEEKESEGVLLRLLQNPSLDENDEAVELLAGNMYGSEQTDESPYGEVMDQQDNTDAQPTRRTPSIFRTNVMSNTATSRGRLYLIKHSIYISSTVRMTEGEFLPDQYQVCRGTTFQETIKKLRLKCVANGFGIYIAQSYKTEHSQVYILRCECAGQWKSKRDQTKKQRKEKSSKKSNCLFKIKLEGSDANHSIKIQNETHNHNLSFMENAWNSSRKITEEKKEILRPFVETFTKPMKVQQILENREEPVRIRARDYTNFAQKQRKIERSQKTELEIIRNLASCKGWVCSENTVGSVLSALFLVPPEAKPYFQSNAQFLAMDTTYRTNANDYHLLQVVGVSSTLQSLPLAFCFLSAETASQYRFALSELKKVVLTDPAVVITDKDASIRSAIQSVFPSTQRLLCSWHAAESIFTKARSYYPLEQSTHVQNLMRTVLRSPTETEAISAYSSLIEEVGVDSEMAEYLDSNWWSIRESVCEFSTKRFLRFRFTTTGLCEGAHSTLKTFLGTSRFRLDSTFQLLSQHTTLRCRRVRDQETQNAVSRPSFTRSTDFFSPIVGKVSTAALELIFVEMHQEQTNPPLTFECTHEIRSSHGLPCHCELQHLTTGKRQLTLDLLNPCWRLPAKITEKSYIHRGMNKPHKESKLL
ncbi:putative MULE transposase domain protein [Blattamonas nauphoetae]|uniref:MULE transposase domain protein n=1 Tax=Blattamonas nauphoetae TaxID=2049346 RepID=A0ABQ9YJN4_9EUKA|nr:putative MULE transposase domain protein [Blattamonas nauphoetae]